MPLFGKKKTDAEKKAEEAKKQEALGGASYPRQQGGAASSSNQPYAPRYCVQQPLPGQQYVVPQGPPVAYPMAPPPYQPYQQVQQTYICQESNFAAGARFGAGHGSRPGIPPPPPGVMPNMAQIASSQGHNVVVSQNQQTIMGGTGDAGAVLW